MGAFFWSRGHSSSSGKTSEERANWYLGKGSIKLDRPSSVSSNLAIAPIMADKPLPTNKWWTGLINTPDAEPIFNIPWSVKMAKTGLQAGIPRVVAKANSVLAPMTTDIVIKPADSALSRVQVGSYDDMSVVVDGIDGSGGVPFSTRFVKGLPFIFITYSKPLAMEAENNLPKVGQLTDGRRTAKVTVNGQFYEVVSSPGSSIRLSGKTTIINPSGRSDKLVLMAIPIDATPENVNRLEEASQAEVIGTKAAFTVKGESVETNLTYRVNGNKQTMHVVLPAQRLAGANILGSVGTFPTIRGQGIVVIGNNIEYTQKVPNHLSGTLPLPKESAFFQKSKLDKYLSQATKDMAVTGASYTGGKDLFRLSNLLAMSHASGSATEAIFKAKLRNELIDWMTYSAGEKGKYLAYDERVKGIVAVSPEFGNDTFNDHHFQYGYFLYAASIMGQFDPDFVKDYGKVVDLMANDLAMISNDDRFFPRLRVYDPYEGHSWADGLAKFADGNNQESVSEAANAWYGLMEWGRISRNSELEKTGQWLYANETSASLTYYFNNGNSGAFPDIYTHHQISLLWGGKSDWATWFSATPEAKHMILMLPLTGGSLYLNTGSNLTSDFLALSRELEGKPTQGYSDILLMAQAMITPQSSQIVFSESLKTDSSNSLAYVYYWLGLSGQGILKASDR